MFKTIEKMVMDLFKAHEKEYLTPKDRLFSGKVCNATLLDAPGKYYRQILLPTRVYYSGEMLFFEEVEVGVRKNTGIFHHSSRVKDIKDVGQNTFRFETATSAAYIVSLL